MGNPASNNGYQGRLTGFDVSLKNDFGVKPIIVDQGQAVTIVLRSESTQPVFYGYSGGPDQRKKIEGQEFEDFDIKESELNRMYTWADYGQFPYIAYNKV